MTAVEAPTARGGTAPPALAFADVYAAHSSFVWRSLRRLGVPSTDIEDASQETFVVIHRRLAEFQHRSSLKTWVFGICLRVASDWRKRAHLKRETAFDEAPVQRTQSGDLPTAAIARRQARQKLDRALDALDEDKRAVFVLFELEQLPMQEVAETVGCPVQTAYARLYAARKIITEWVGQQQQQEAAL